MPQFVVVGAIVVAVFALRWSTKSIANRDGNRKSSKVFVFFMMFALTISARAWAESPKLAACSGAPIAASGEKAMRVYEAISPGLNRPIRIIERDKGDHWEIFQMLANVPANRAMMGHMHTLEINKCDASIRRH